ncbi:MAG: hypothetical protein MRK02_13725 [Candidatus Scalindua sp.]|nr:hypothetical protein [Candidatus Scalindua sp.]
MIYLKESTPKGIFYSHLRHPPPLLGEWRRLRRNKKAFVNISQRISKRSIVATIVKIGFLTTI